MKIFLCGAQGVGKSTIVNNIDLDLIKHDSFSKKFINKNNKNIQLGGDSIEFLDMQQKIFVYCTNIYTNESYFISSRSLIDTLAYIDNDTKFSDEMNNIHNMSVDMLNNINRQDDVFYFYIPIEFDIEGDSNSIRIPDKEYQAEIDRRILYHLNDNNVEFTVLSGSVDERLSQIYKTINDRINHEGNKL